MRKPPIVGNQQQFQSQVVEMWGKLTLSPNVPLVEDMEVGEARVLDTTSSTPSDYKLYVKTNLNNVVVFCGCLLIGTAFSDGFSEGFEI